MLKNLQQIQIQDQKKNKVFHLNITPEMKKEMRNSTVDMPTFLYGSFYSNRAICYFNLNRFEECIRDCNNALRMNPQLSKAHKKKYQACLNVLKFDEAVEAAKSYANLEKNHAANN